MRRQSLSSECVIQRLVVRTDYCQRSCCASGIRTLIKCRKKRRQDGGRDTDNAQHALEIECIQRELDQCRGQLRRAQAERDELKREVDEWRDAARTAQQQREALKQQLVDAVGPLPITAEPPKRDRVSQPQLTSFFARSKKRQRSTVDNLQKQLVEAGARPGGRGCV